MAQSKGWVRRYFKAFCKGFFVAVPVAVTFLDRVACVARVEGASMQPSLNPGGSQSSDVVLLNHWKVRNFEVQRGDIVSLVSTTVNKTDPSSCPDDAYIIVKEDRQNRDRNIALAQFRKAHKKFTNIAQCMVSFLGCVQV
uniref:mitochondrial inner membrane protease subunit 2 isoform X3 n=1 Tax=Panthera onca TaxID=9690 RepID=UPI0029558A0A|nr:mitochondrial inner membrane protease subunit 2 isoform X3 [Panthera onca]